MRVLGPHQGCGLKGDHQAGVVAAVGVEADIMVGTETAEAVVVAGDKK